MSLRWSLLAAMLYVIGGVTEQVSVLNSKRRFLKKTECESLLSLPLYFGTIK